MKPFKVLSKRFRVAVEVWQREHSLDVCWLFHYLAQECNLVFNDFVSVRHGRVEDLRQGMDAEFLLFDDFVKEWFLKHSVNNRDSFAMLLVTMSVLFDAILES